MVSEEADELLRETVISARYAGLNWEQIGKPLGLSRQEAQQKFSAFQADGSGGTDLVEHQANKVATLPAVGTTVVVPRGKGAGNDGEVPLNIAGLNRAGQYGWHAVSFDTNSWTLQFDNQQWQHAYIAGVGKMPKGDGWQRIGRNSIWVYFARPTHLPILPGNPPISAFRSEWKLQDALQGR